MLRLPNMVDLAKTPEDIAEDKLESSPGNWPQNLYPYGLSISLENEQLEKLNLSSDVKVGDKIAFAAIGTVTAASERDTDKGPKCRVEIQITHLSLSEAHNEEAPKKPKPGYDRIYNDSLSAKGKPSSDEAE